MKILLISPWRKSNTIDTLTVLLIVLISSLLFGFDFFSQRNSDVSQDVFSAELDFVHFQPLSVMERMIVGTILMN